MDGQIESVTDAVGQLSLCSLKNKFSKYNKREQEISVDISIYWFILKLDNDNKNLSPRATVDLRYETVYAVARGPQYGGPGYGYASLSSLTRGNH